MDYNEVPQELVDLCKKWYLLRGKDFLTCDSDWMYNDYYISKIYNDIQDSGDCSEFYGIILNKYHLITDVCGSFTDSFVEYMFPK